MGSKQEANVWKSACRMTGLKMHQEGGRSSETGKHGHGAHVHADNCSDRPFNCLQMLEARAAQVQAEVKRHRKGQVISEASPQAAPTLAAAPRQRHAHSVPARGA